MPLFARVFKRHGQSIVHIETPPKMYTHICHGKSTGNNNTYMIYTYFQCHGKHVGMCCLQLLESNFITNSIFETNFIFEEVRSTYTSVHINVRGKKARGRKSDFILPNVQSFDAKLNLFTLRIHASTSFPLSPPISAVHRHLAHFGSFLNKVFVAVYSKPSKRYYSAKRLLYVA